MNYLTHSDKGFLQQLDLVNKTRSAMVLDEMFGTRLSETVGVRGIIYGSELCDMYDHAPGEYFFTRDAERPVVFPDGIGMAQLRDIAADEFQRYREESDAQQEHHGMFFPMGIRILSAHDEVIDLYKDGRWTIDSDVIPRSQWDDVESEIAQSRSEASIEAGWDNVDTARSLRQQARRLEERLSLSRHSLSTSTLRD